MVELPTLDQTHVDQGESSFTFEGLTVFSKPSLYSLPSLINAKISILVEALGQQNQMLHLQQHGIILK